MKLILTISPPPRGGPGDPSSVVVFDEAGGTIGRANGNSLILRHDNVSGKHARVTFRDGCFYIQDTSTNGTALNNPGKMLAKNTPHPLEHDDRLFIVPYEIDVAIQEDDRPPVRANRFGVESSAAPVTLDRGSPSDSPAGDVVDVLDFFEPVKAAKAVAPRAQPGTRVPEDPLKEPYRPPEARREDPPPRVQPEGIPSNFDIFEERESGILPGPIVRPRPQSKPRPEPAPSSRPATEDTPPRDPSPEFPPPPASSESALPGSPVVQQTDVRELLRGAGLPDAAVTPELMREMGEILRVVVAGLIDVLQSRQQIKAEFRLEHTVVRPSGNNPLKSSANVKDALHNLFVKRNAAYLGPVQAFAEAFDDLRDHQLAMLAGMRVAFEAMLAEFDPDRLQASFDRELAKLTLPLVPAKLRYWDLYRQRRAELMGNGDAAFQRLFGEDFGQAYEEQLRRLKALRQEAPRPDPRGAEPD